jgi:hypothetical protein
VTARAGHRSGDAGDGRASPGIWSVFQRAADDGGVAGPIAAQTCGQAGRDLDTAQAGQEADGQPEPRRRAVSPGPQAELLAEPADADPPTSSTVQRVLCPSGRVGQVHADRVNRRIETSAGSAADTRSLPRRVAGRAWRRLFWCLCFADTLSIVRLPRVPVA